MTAALHREVPTRTTWVDGTPFVYRELGPAKEVPVVFLGYLSAVLDDWDPRIVDGLAARHRVITFDNRGVGASGGRTSTTIDAMARDAIAFIRSLGYDQVDLLGYSMGGMVAQEIARRDPLLVRRMVLAGTAPAGGTGLEKLTRIAVLGTLRGALTLRDGRYYLLFPPTPHGRAAARNFLARLQERATDRDRRITVRSLLAQLRAIRDWSRRTPDLALVDHPTLVANGDDDRMVPTANSRVLAELIRNSRLVIYPDSGHGGVFQHHAAFRDDVLDFLA